LGNEFGLAGNSFGSVGNSFTRVGNELPTYGNYFACEVDSLPTDGNSLPGRGNLFGQLENEFRRLANDIQPSKEKCAERQFNPNPETETLVKSPVPQGPTTIARRFNAGKWVYEFKSRGDG
jgi:hypothetical protein